MQEQTTSSHSVCECSDPSCTYRPRPDPVERQRRLVCEAEVQVCAQDPTALLRLREVVDWGPVMRRPGDDLLEAAGLVQPYLGDGPAWDVGYSVQVVGTELAGWWDYFVDPRSVGYRRP